MTIEPGTRFGSYEVTSLLGTGGMGEVYRARDLKLGRPVAIKVLREELSAEDDRVRRFEQEARAASALNHPNIIHIYDIGELDGQHYMAMEYVEGKTLRDILKEGPLPTKKLLRLTTQIADGMAKAHAAGIVHRDLKPENLMVTEDGFVKILDFGLAKLTVPDTSEVGSELETMTRATQAGVIMGTIQYMSPEQAAGRQVDHRSDQFSFGSIVYEMATGKPAFKKATTVQTLAAIIEREPEPIDIALLEATPGLRAILERCLSKDPGKRYDSTDELARELRQESEASASTVTRRAPARAPGLPGRRAMLGLAGAFLVALVVTAIALNVGGLRDRLRGSASPGINSLAVLPLANLSGDPEQEYFAEGMTEALITDLAKIETLKVISKTSAMRFKGTDKTIPEIARILNVDAVVEGSVQQAGDTVRITAQLIDGQTDEHLWAESYDRERENVLVLMSEVARAIADRIEVALTPQQQSRLASAKVVSPEVQEKYLKARFFFSRLVGDNLAKASALYQETIEQDPTFAPAYAGLALTEAVKGFFIGEESVARRGEAAALKALELDPDLSEPHVALGVVRLYFDWDWAAAAAEFRRALDLNPNDAVARHGLADYLLWTGDLDESVRQVELGRQADPLSPLTIGPVIAHLVFARRYDEAIAQAEEAIEFLPDVRVFHSMLSDALWQRGFFERALAEGHKAGPWASQLTDLMESGYRQGGPRVAMRAVADFGAQSETEQFTPLSVAYYYAEAGEKELALEWLQKALDARVPQLVHIKAEPAFDSMRSDPRFQAIVQQMSSPRER